jgi:hypothetical protein
MAMDTRASATSTPFLDRRKPLPPLAGRRSTRLEVLSGAIVGAVIAVGFAAARTPIPFEARAIEWARVTFAQTLAGQLVPVRLLAVALAVVLTFYAAVAVHEVGHVLAGVAAGFRFNSFRVGVIHINAPFRLSRYRGGQARAVGLASLFPGTTDRLAARTLVMLLAGPLSNLVTGVGVLLLPFHKGVLMGGFAGWSIVLGAANLLPFERKSVVSDGKRILMLIAHPPQGERWLAIMTLGDELRRGVEPESMTPTFLAKAIAVQDNSPDTVTAYGLAYAAAFYREDEGEAARLLEVCLAHAGAATPAAREALASDAAVFLSRLGKLDLAEAWLADVPPATYMPGLRLRAEGAILHARGDRDGAFSKLDEVETMLLAIPNETQRTASLRFHRRWVSYLKTCK